MNKPTGPTRPFTACLLLTLTLALQGCAMLQDIRLQSALRHRLDAFGPSAEHSFYACLANGLAQGLPIKQVSDACAHKLLDAPEGGGVGGIPGPIGGHDPFDPGSVQANCAAGDPALSQTYSKEAVGYHGGDLSKYFNDWRKTGYDPYGVGSYGGKGLKDGDGSEFIGFSKEESQALKKAAIERYEAIVEKRLEVEKDIKTETDPAKKKQLQDDLKLLEKVELEAYKEAQKDPNQKEPGKPNSQPGPLSVCEETLQAAREILFECNRTGWRTAQCQILAAKMNNCPDPRYIYVIPEGGYTCGEKVDPEAVKDAWIAHCERLARYDPEGRNPCRPGTVDNMGRFVDGRSGGICSDPFAYVEGGFCYVPMEVRTPFKRASLQEIVVWALDRFGGPIVVLPLPPRPPRVPGPGPGPSPNVR